MGKIKDGQTYKELHLRHGSRTRTLEAALVRSFKPYKNSDEVRWEASGTDLVEVYQGKGLPTRIDRRQATVGFLLDDVIDFRE